MDLGVIKRLLKILLGTNLVSLRNLIFFRPHFFAGSSLAAFTAARRPPEPAATEPGPTIPEITLDEVLRGRNVPVQLRVATFYEDGMLPHDQAATLAAILVAESPRTVLEIGTFMGHSTRLMAENLVSATIHTVDLPPGYDPTGNSHADLRKDDFHLIRKRIVGREFKNEPCAQRIVQHYADTGTWDFSAAGAPTFFFIDGSHSYDYVRNDSEKCFAVCQGRGVFLWHDCDPSHPGVLRLLHEWRAMGRDVRRISGTPIGYWKSGGA